jgi:hypothetical protein
MKTECEVPLKVHRHPRPCRVSPYALRMVADAVGGWQPGMDGHSNGGYREVTSLAICFDPLSMSRLLGAISANCHAAPAALPASRLICEEQRARSPLARLYVSEVL